MYNKPIICLSFPSWEGEYTKSTVELMKEISKLRKVVFIDYPYSFLDIIRSKNKNIPYRRILKNTSFTPSEYPNLTIYNLPAIIPFQSVNISFIFNILVYINGILIKRRLNKIRKIEKINEAEWISALNPIIGNILKTKYPSENFHYYCYDDISSMNWVNERNTKSELKFIKQCKHVFCTSKNLLNKCLIYNSNSSLIENGVNTSVFKESSKQNSNNKIVGYIGSIDDRLDIPLLVKIINAKPNLQFQFIGRVVDYNIKAKLEDFTNVEFIPAMEPTLLSQYVSKFDIGLIPFVRNQFTENIYPMKVNEYLALGVPVISTNFSDLSSLASIIKITNDISEFQLHLEEELLTDNEIKRQDRIAFAKDQSWANRAKKLYSTINNQ